MRTKRSGIIPKKFHPEMVKKAGRKEGGKASFDLSLSPVRGHVFFEKESGFAVTG